MKSKDKPLTKNAFRELQKVWYKRLDESGFNDIERSGRRRQDLFKEYSGLLQKPLSILRHKYNKYTQIYYEISRFLANHATFLPKIDRNILELHGDGYTIAKISSHLRDNYKYPLNKKGRKGKPYSVFYVHTKLKYLKLLILVYAKTDCLETVKISWQSL